MITVDAVSSLVNFHGLKKTAYYPWFDYLRIVLATAVAASHAGVLTWNQAGNLPVQIFFALSGWLIGGILLQSASHDLPRFYFNRAARIWIPYFLAIFLLVAVSVLKDPITAKWIEFISYKVTFVYNFFGPPQLAEFTNAMPLQGTGNHFWSICAEEQFYLVAPILITIIPAGRTIWFWVLISLVAIWSPYWGYFAAISLGVLAAVLRSKFGAWHTIVLARVSHLGFVIIVFAATYFETIAYRIGAPLLSAAVVVLLAQPGQHSASAAFVGGMSYPMYLNHWIGVFVANTIFSRFDLRGSELSKYTSIIVALGIAAILYMSVDKIVRANREKFFTTKRGRIAASIGYALVLVGLSVGFSYSGAL